MYLLYKALLGEAFERDGMELIMGFPECVILYSHNWKTGASPQAELTAIRVPHTSGIFFTSIKYEEKFRIETEDVIMGWPLDRVGGYAGFDCV